MDINEIIQNQRQFDLRHGFKIIREPLEDKYKQISHELIGLFGEVGEIANIVKKINLSIDNNIAFELQDLVEKEEHIREELIDVFIYFLRISDFVDLDVDEEYNKKLQVNENKYRGINE